MKSENKNQSRRSHNEKTKILWNHFATNDIYFGGLLVLDNLRVYLVSLLLVIVRLVLICKVQVDRIP